MENGGERETIGRTNIENRKGERENGRREKGEGSVGGKSNEREKERER